MILHTIIGVWDVLYGNTPEKLRKSEKPSTDPFCYLEKDEYYKKYVQRRK